RVWAQRAADRARASLDRGRRELQVIHYDMPEITDLRLDRRTGKHRAVLSAMDVLRSVHLGLCEDQANDEDGARFVSDIERARVHANARTVGRVLDRIAVASHRR